MENLSNFDAYSLVFGYISKLMEHGKKFEKDLLDAETNLRNGLSQRNVCEDIEKQAEEVKHPEVGPQTTEMAKRDDYPHDAKLMDKIVFFMEQRQRAWRRKHFIEFLELHEGEEKTKKLVANLNRTLKELCNSGVLVCAKYCNSGRYSFYIKQEWRVEGPQKDIHPDFFPTEADFGNLAPEKRKPELIFWVVDGMAA